MTLKVFDTEIELKGPPYEFDPEILELSLLCEDDKGRIFTFNEIDIGKLNHRYYLLFGQYDIKKIYEKTIEKYPYDNVKKWFAIFLYKPYLFPINTPLKEIFKNYDFSEYLSVTKRDLTEQEITEIIDLINSNRVKSARIDEFYQLIKFGYTKLIDKLEQNILIKIGKLMIKNRSVSSKNNLELFKRIKIKGPNQVVWIIKNKLYPLLNLNNFSKKNWIEAKDEIIRNIHNILPYIDKKTFDIIEPMLEWDKYKERKPDDLKYKINNIGIGYNIIPRYFNHYSDQDVMKEIYKKFYSSNLENEDIHEAQFNFCFSFERFEKRVSNLEDVKNKIEFWKKVEYALTN